MQPLEIDSAVFCDGARYTIISRENSSILTCPVASGAGGYTLNRVEGRDIDLELDRLTGHAACIAVDVPTWCRIAADNPDAIGSGAAVLTATIGLGGVDTAEIGVSCADMPEDGSLLIEGAAWPIADGDGGRAFFGFEDTAGDPKNPLREVPAGADGAKRLADAALAASCATLSPNTADPCLVARLAAEARERSRSLTDPCTQARGAKRAAGSSKQDGTADGRRPAL